MDKANLLTTQRVTGQTSSCTCRKYAVDPDCPRHAILQTATRAKSLPK